MDRLAYLFRKIWILVRRDKFLSELDEEMAFHRELTEKELREEGAAVEEAHHAATRQFGNTARLKDQSHEIVGFRFESVLQDLRFAIRQLIHNRGFSLVAIVVLSLGIGISTAMFTVLKSVLFDKPAIPHIERLVTLDEPRGKVETFWAAALPDLRDWRAQSHSFEQIAYYDSKLCSMEQQESTEQIQTFTASSNFFAALGVTPLLGRTFVTSDEQNKAKVVVLNYHLWQKNFQGDPKILGRTIKLDGESYQIIGVMPKGLTYPFTFTEESGLWQPYVANSLAEDRNHGSVTAFGRLLPGVKLQAAQTELSGIQARLANAYSAKDPLPDHVLVRRYWDTVVGKVRPALLTLAIAVGLVWLVSCANVASLMLTRNATRQREIAIRGALGAGKQRIVRLLLTENLILSICSGLIGLLLSYAVIRILGNTILKSLNQQDLIHLQVDWTALFVVIALSLLSTLTFGLLPAIEASRISLQQSLQVKTGDSNRHQSRLRDGLVIGEIALSVLLLVAAGLLLRTIYSLHHVPLGFRTENLLTSGFSIPKGKYDQLNINTALYQPLLDRVEQLPGVQSATITSVIPLSSTFKMLGMFDIVGQHESSPDKKPQGDLRFSSPKYPATLGITVERGRFFDPKIDTPTSQPVAVVNHTFAALYLHDEDPLTKQMSMGDNSPWSAVPIVGVISDVRETAVGVPPGPEIHLSTTQLAPGAKFYGIGSTFAQIAIRTQNNPTTIIKPVEKILYNLAPDVVALDFLTMSQVVEDSLASQTLAAKLISIFAGTTLLIAITGLYGLINYSVSQRTREVGIRMALGAQRQGIILMVLLRATMLLAIGLSSGVALALVSSRLLRSFLYGVQERDLITIASVCLLLALSGVIAAYLPARRAASVNPMEALRAE